MWSQHLDFVLKTHRPLRNRVCQFPALGLGSFIITVQGSKLRSKERRWETRCVRLEGKQLVWSVRDILNTLRMNRAVWLHGYQVKETLK